MLLILAIHYGSVIAADPYWAKIFTLEAPTLAIVMMAYGFIASVLLCGFTCSKRLSFNFLKIGVIVVMAVAIVLVAPDLQMPKANTQYFDGAVQYLQVECFHFYLLPLLVVRSVVFML